MLGKLIKYDLKANRNLFLLMYAVLTVTALGSRIAMSEVFEELEGFSGVAVIAVLVVVSYFVAVVAVSVMEYVLIIRRFYNNLFGSEGYLSFTLPVTASQHFWAKVLSALIWVLCSTIVQIVSLMIVFSGLMEPELFGQSAQIYEEVISQLTSVGDMIWQSVVGIFDGVAGLLMIYFAICLGQMANRRRVLASIVYYFGMNFIFNMINSLVME